MTQQLHDNRITALYCRLSRDDGYSGTNFNRPDFSRMIEMVEHNTISTVVVKGLSRLGREYLQTGYYSEIFFPMHDVRFIAINDGVDTQPVRTSSRRSRTCQMSPTSGISTLE